MPTDTGCNDTNKTQEKRNWCMMAGYVLCIFSYTCTRICWMPVPELLLLFFLYERALILLNALSYFLPLNGYLKNECTILVFLCTELYSYIIWEDTWMDKKCKYHAVIQIWYLKILQSGNGIISYRICFIVIRW